MERGWLETIRLLGLDVELIIVLAMLMLDTLISLGRRLARAARQRIALQRRGSGESRDDVAADPHAWPPPDLRPSH